ncbi:MAG: exopolysaccharide biosynthesis protein [Microcystaceae cyanobacterium]
MQLKFSQDIEVLLNKVAEESLTLRDVLAVTAERGFCLMIAFLALPFIFPIPPGLTGIPGLGILLLAGQMVCGYRRPWLPNKIANFPFPQGIAKQLLGSTKLLTRILERITRPRFLTLTSNRYIWRFNGVIIAWLTILLILPIPFTNPLPAIGIFLLVVAMLEADGLLMCFAYGWTSFITAGLFMLGSSLWDMVFHHS